MLVERPVYWAPPRSPIRQRLMGDAEGTTGGLWMRWNSDLSTRRG